MINDEADEVFVSLKKRYQNKLESIKGNELVFNYVHLLCYKYHKKNTNCVGSCIDSRDWIKSKKRKQ